MLYVQLSATLTYMAAEDSNGVVIPFRHDRNPVSRPDFSLDQLDASVTRLETDTGIFQRRTALCLKEAELLLADLISR